MFDAGVTANSPLPEVVGGTQIGEVDLHEDYIGSMLLLSRFLRYFRLRHSSNPVTRRPPMLSRLALVGTLVLGCTGAILAQHSSEPEPYTDEDAYQVYNALLSQESSRSTVVIDAETVAQFSGKESHSWGPEDCIDPRVAGEFKDAIADYNRLNRSRWLLQRKFSAPRPYEVLDSTTSKALFQNGGWKAFYQRFPNSGGPFEMSAVGFNKDKTRAVVWFGYACGSLCGDWRFRLFKKVDGKWQEVRGVICHRVS